MLKILLSLRLWWESLQSLCLWSFSRLALHKRENCDLHHLIFWIKNQFSASRYMYCQPQANPIACHKCFLASKKKVVAEFCSMFITLCSLAETALFHFLYKPPYLSASLPISPPLARQNWTWHNALLDISDHPVINASVCSHFPRIQQPTVSFAESLLLPRWDIRPKHLLFVLPKCK